VRQKKSSCAIKRRMRWSQRLPPPGLFLSWGVEKPGGRMSTGATPKTPGSTETFADDRFQTAGKIQPPSTRYPLTETTALEFVEGRQPGRLSYHDTPDSDESSTGQIAAVWPRQNHPPPRLGRNFMGLARRMLSKPPTGTRAEPNPSRLPAFVDVANKYAGVRAMESRHPVETTRDHSQGKRTSGSETGSMPDTNQRPWRTGREIDFTKRQRRRTTPRHFPKTGNPLGGIWGRTDVDSRGDSRSCRQAWRSALKKE